MGMTASRRIRPIALLAALALAGPMLPASAWAEPPDVTVRQVEDRPGARGSVQRLRCPMPQGCIRPVALRIDGQVLRYLLAIRFDQGAAALALMPEDEATPPLSPDLTAPAMLPLGPQGGRVVLGLRRRGQATALLGAAPAEARAEPSAESEEPPLAQLAVRITLAP